MKNLKELSPCHLVTFYKFCHTPFHISFALLNNDEEYYYLHFLDKEIISRKLNGIL